MARRLGRVGHRRPRLCSGQPGDGPLEGSMDRFRAGKPPEAAVFGLGSYASSCKDQQDSVPRMMQHLLRNTTVHCGQLLADWAGVTLLLLRRLGVQQQARSAVFQYWRRHTRPEMRPGCHCMIQPPRELVWLSAMLPSRSTSQIGIATTVSDGTGRRSREPRRHHPPCYSQTGPSTTLGLQQAG